jgi:hypothetical protein
MLHVFIKFLRPTPLASLIFDRDSVGCPTQGNQPRQVVRCVGTSVAKVPCVKVAADLPMEGEDNTAGG